jgi:hypothetical protein
VSNFHARNFFKTKTNCTDMIHANMFYLCTKTIAIAHCVQRISSKRPEHQNDDNKQTAKSATHMRAASSCPFFLPE